MPQKRKTSVKINDANSLENLLQETYGDACVQISDAQRVINELTNGSEPEDVRDYTDIAAQRTNALKIKDSAIKIKLDIAKLQTEIIKHTGDSVKSDDNKVTSSPTTDDFAAIREMFKKKKEESNNIYEVD